MRSVNACGSGLLGCYRGGGATPRHCKGASTTKNERLRSGDAGRGHHSTGISQIHRPQGRCETSLTERSARETIISHPSEKQLSSEIVLISFESWSNEIVPPTPPPQKHFMTVEEVQLKQARVKSWFHHVRETQRAEHNSSTFSMYRQKIHTVPKPCRPPTCRGSPGGKPFLLSSS